MVEAGERLGLLLEKAGIVTSAQLNDALEVHKATGAALGRVLVDLGYASQKSVLAVVAAQVGVPYVDFDDIRPDPNAVAVVPMPRFSGSSTVRRKMDAFA